MTRTLIAAGHVQSSDRDRLVIEYEAARRAYAERPWDEGAEVMLCQAVLALQRHDQTKKARPPH